jgi:hypothetical protein
VEHGWDAGLRPQPRAPSAHSLSPPPGRAGARRRKLWERGGGGLGDELWVAPDGGATRSLGAVGGGGGVGGEGERERERADGSGGGMGRTASLLAPVIRHREACLPVPGMRREAVCWLLSR